MVGWRARAGHDRGIGKIADTVGTQSRTCSTGRKKGNDD
jgi:hypothetical protein